MYQFTLAGCKFRPVECQAEVIASVVGTEFLLSREPGNPHDQNAIRVLSARTNAHLGYVPRNVAKRLAAEMDDSTDDFVCFVDQNNGTKEPLLIADARHSSAWMKRSVFEHEMSTIIDDEVPF